MLSFQKGSENNIISWGQRIVLKATLNENYHFQVNHEINMAVKYITNCENINIGITTYTYDVVIIINNNDSTVQDKITTILLVKEAAVSKKHSLLFDIANLTIRR